MQKQLRLLLLFCLSISTYAQSLGTAGTIRGKITDPSGALIAGATVESRLTT